MTLPPGEYKTLLRLVSTATNEIVTRKKLSEQSRGSASATAAALRELLNSEPKLASVKRQLDQASSMLSRPSPCLDEACAMIDAAQAKASTGGKKKKTSKKKASGTKAAASTAATSDKQVAGKKASKKKSAGGTKKRASAKKVAATG